MGTPSHPMKSKQVCHDLTEPASLSQGHANLYGTLCASRGRLLAPLPSGLTRTAL